MYKCRLRVILAEREMRQDDLRNQVNISKSTLSKLVNNKALPEFDTAYRIAKALDMYIEEIWKEERKMYKVVFWRYGTRSYDEFETEEKARESFRRTESGDTTSIECVLDPDDHIIEGKNIGEKYEWD